MSSLICRGLKAHSSRPFPVHKGSGFQAVVVSAAKLPFWDLYAINSLLTHFEMAFVEIDAITHVFVKIDVTFWARTTGAISCKRAQLRANGRKSKKCTFWNFQVLFFSPLNRSSSCWIATNWILTIVSQDQSIWTSSTRAFWASSFDCTMTSRLHSANTLMDGMNQVTDATSSRKRELEAMMAVPYLKMMGNSLVAYAWGSRS